LGFVAQGAAVGGFRTYIGGGATLLIDTDIAVI
jgi:hypothetical protein